MPLDVNAFDLDSIDLYVNARCNRRCAYCFLPDSFLDSGAAMTRGMAEEIIGWARPGVREVTFLGGEPSLHPEIRALVLGSADMGLETRLVTNGSAPFRRLLDDPLFVGALTRAAISLDHFDSARVSELRGRLGYSDALSAAWTLREAGVPFAINCTVTSLLAESVDEMIAFVDALGAERLNLHWLSEVGRARSRPDLLVDPDSWHRVLERVAAYRPARPGFRVDCELGWIYDDPPDGSDTFSCAVSARTNLEFLPDGRVFSCGMVVESDTLHGYEWIDGHLWARSPHTTETTAASKSCGHCPLRASTPESGRLRPACIYQRAYSGHAAPRRESEPLHDAARLL